MLQNERGQQVHENFISFFFEKKINLGQFDLFSLEAIFYCLIGHGQTEPGHC